MVILLKYKMINIVDEFKIKFFYYKGFVYC